MASTYSNLKFELIGTGDQSGTWGTTTNTNLGTAIEQALVGMATISSGFTGSPLTLTLTLTDTNAAQNARALVLNLTQSLGSAGTLNVPAIQKPYMIINATGQTVTVKVTGLTGVAVPTGKRAFLYNNGTDVGNFFNYADTLSLGTDLAVADGGTGISSGTSGGVPYFSASTTIASSAALAANAIVIGGGAGVAPSTTTTGTGVVTAIGNNTNAASGLAVLNASGNLNVAQGGTGAGTFTANNVLLGNGTSAFQVVAPGSTGNVLTSNGTTWTSAAAAGGALTNNTRQAVTSSATTTINLNSGNVIDLTMAASITSLSFTNVPASGTPILIQIVVKNASDGTAYTIAWPNSVYWSGQYSATTISTVQTAPTLATGANGVTVIALLTTDGGTKWRGWVEATIPGGTLGSLYAMGFNFQGQLGQSNLIYRSSPVQVGALANWSSSFSSQRRSVAAVKTDGTLWTWGYNDFGQLGLNVSNSASSPTQVGSLTNWSSVAKPLANSSEGVSAVKSDGTLWSWGRNQIGQLGLNNTVNVSSPIQVGSGTSWSKIARGSYTSFAIKTDGTLWSWGVNEYGNLGLNQSYPAVSNVSSPVQVGASTDWADVAAFGRAGLALKTNGTIWSWGRNVLGNLGLNGVSSGTTGTVSSPTQIGALTTWSKIATSTYHALALKTDGTLWTWGSNQFGQLGLGDVNNISSPVQIGALTTWTLPNKEMSTAVWVPKTDGTLWVWGRNQYGQLGLGDVILRSSPVQLGALTSWSAATGDRAALLLSSTSINPA